MTQDEDRKLPHNCFEIIVHNLGTKNQFYRAQKEEFLLTSFLTHEHVENTKFWQQYPRLHKIRVPYSQKRAIPRFIRINNSTTATASS